MKKAGVDCGTTLAKFAWEEDGELRLASTADRAVDDIIAEMVAAGVTHARVTGIGTEPVAGSIIATRGTGDPIGDEVERQAEGARLLLKESDGPDSFLLVSVGTGTSYASVRPDLVARYPIGNAIGGGFVWGLAQAAATVPDFGLFESLAAVGQPPDIRVEDLLPATKGTLQGAFIVSNFGNAHTATNKADICAGLLHCLAVQIVRDILLFDPNGDMSDIVFVGSTVGRSRTLRKYLRTFLGMLGKTPRFPANAEYAAAIGALHAP